MADSNLRAATQRSRIVELPDGSTLEIRPLTVRDWGTLEEAAVAAAKRDLLSTWIANLDLLPEDERAPARAKAFERAEALTSESLPASKMQVPKVDSNGKHVIVDGKPVMTVQDVPYVHQWLNNTFKGQLMAAWLSVRRANPAITMDDVADLFQRVGEAALSTVADNVGDLSKPTLGNE